MNGQDGLAHLWREAQRRRGAWFKGMFLRIFATRPVSLRRTEDSKTVPRPTLGKTQQEAA
jgi:hypothetical protein